MAAHCYKKEENGTILLCCPICGATEWRLIVKKKKNFFQYGDGVYACAKCNWRSPGKFAYGQKYY